MALAGGVGVTVDTGSDISVPWMFGEDQGRYLITCSIDSVDAIKDKLADEGVQAFHIGVTGGDTIGFADGTSLNLSILRQLYESWFPGYMAA